MNESVSLLEYVRLLMADAVERAHFAADPDASLARHGLADLGPADVHDAVRLVQETLTVDWAQAYGSGASTPSPALELSTTTEPSWWQEHAVRTGPAHDLSPWPHEVVPEVGDGADIADAFVDLPADPHALPDDTELHYGL